MDANDNELAYLEAIHFFVEVLDSFFGNVCELDLVFNFYKVSTQGGCEGEGGIELISWARCMRFSTRCSLLARLRKPANRLC